MKIHCTALRIASDSIVVCWFCLFCVATSVVVVAVDVMVVVINSLV